MSCDAILVLVCGLPAAGKTTLVKHLVNTGNTASRLYERISFDDVYEEMVGNDGDGKASEFNPGKWKESQQAMVARVTERLEDQSASASDNGTTQQLVLLVDDNFQYRSQRKRFFHLAAQLNCGFAVLYVNVSTEICRERNNARGLGGRAGVHVPGEVFERMTTAFEAPDGDQNPWEVSTCELDRADDSVDFVGLMDELIKQAEGELKSRGGLQLERQNEEAQQRLDRLATQQNALHLVDLELRQWISAKLRDETALPAGMTKKELASILNKRRKSFLALMKGFSTDITQGKSIEEVVVSLVARFHQQE
ncbi:L-seryl-tRNA(Sec) kinase [Phytophthora cinnamomi]|uniref:L-seryl-tRNA(Sec) kinase n=1 Tax=Phytophthora cinnamomi TaxID=4785 RepID=UPI003559FE79|nr:L-seryl-tRNA(Sec) kinase [Phytophthora cinnamomi]